MTRFPLSLALLALLACGEPEATEEPFGEARLLIDVPVAGAWVEPGSLTVTGDAQNMREITLDGAQVDVDGGRFSIPMSVPRGIHTFELAGTDLRGDTLFDRRSILAGRFASPETPVESAVRLGVGQEGIDQLVGLADSLLDVDALTADLSAFNPVVTGSLSVVDYSVDLLDVSLDPPVLEVRLEDGRIVIDATIDDFSVDVGIRGEIIGFGLDTTANAAVARTEATLSVTLDAVGGRLDVGLSPIDVTLTGFTFDASLIPGSFEDDIPLLSDAIEGFVVGTLVEQVNTLAPTLIDEVIAGLDPSFEQEILGRRLSASALFRDVVIAPSGLELGLDLDVRIAGARDPKRFAGTLLAPRGARHELPIDRPFRLSLHDDLLNRILFEVWHSDVLNLELSTSDGSLPASFLEMLQASTGTLALRPRLPPVAVDEGGDLRLQVGEMGLTLATPGGGQGDNLVMTAALAASLAPVVSNGALRVVVSTPEVKLMVDDSDWGADKETITNLLESQLPIDSILVLASLASFELPSFFGYALGDADVGRSSAGAHTTVSFSLVEAE